MRLELDVGDPNALELAYEVAKDPYLRVVLEANPKWVESQAGLDFAQVQALQLRQAYLPSAGAAPEGTPAPEPAGIPAGVPVEGWVEPGRSGGPMTPTNEAQRGDEFDEVLALDDMARARPFF